MPELQPLNELLIYSYKSNAKPLWKNVLDIKLIVNDIC